MQRTNTCRQLALISGILSSLLYFAINIFIPPFYNGYSVVTQTVSELSAIGAPTRALWVVLAMIYILLFAVFGWGVLRSAGDNSRLKITGILVFVYSAFNLYWPPMHQRGEAMTMTDTLHITWAGIALLLMILIMGFGAAASGKKFRWFTVSIFVVFFVFGILTSLEAPGVGKNLPTPHIGIWERVNVGAFLSWVIVFAIYLMRKGKPAKE